MEAYTKLCKLVGKVYADNIISSIVLSIEKPNKVDRPMSFIPDLSVYESWIESQGFTIADITGRIKKLDIQIVRDSLLYLYVKNYAGNNSNQMSRIAKMFNRDRTSLYEMMKRVDGYIFTRDDKFIPVYESLVSYHDEGKIINN